jgi:hypothetical protein
MVVNSKFTEEQQYAQCVLELSIAYDNLRTAECNAELKEIEIFEIKGKTRKAQLQRKLKEIELEQLNRARLGAEREFGFLFTKWQSYPKKYTREDLNKAQEKEYKLRLETQAQQDLNATGRISQGNQEGLRQIGILPYPQLDVGREVEQRFLTEGQVKLLIAVATQEKAEKGLPCLEGIEIPSGVQVKYYNSWGRKIDAAYNDIVQQALKDKADFIFTVEDDTFPQKDALIRLFKLINETPNSIVGGWYPKRQKGREGAPIELYREKRRAMPDDGTIREAYTICQGCTLFPVDIFLKIPYPWFKTTENMTQDSFFSQLAREHGYKLLVDTSIKCKHIDRITQEVYE